MKLRPAYLFALCACVFLFLPRLAFAQAAAPALPTSLTPTTVTIALLAAVVAFLTNAYNTGKFFGLATVPVAALPYLGVGIPFVSAVYMSLAQAGGLSGLAVFNATISGFFALLGSASGAGAHNALSDHFGAAKVTMARKARGVIGVALLCLGLGALLSTQTACTKAQGAAVETVTVDSTICVLTHFSDPPAQIATECGLATVQDVINILDAANQMAVRKAAGEKSVQP